MTNTAAAVERVIAALAGPGATARDDQLPAVEALVAERRRVLVVQATGWGKSAVYWAATAAIRSPGGGPTLVVSPLLALMRDQIAAAGARRAARRPRSTRPTSTSGTTVLDRRRRRRPSTCCSCHPSGSPTRASRARLGRCAALRAAGDRRGALHLRLGLRLPPRLPAAVRGPAPLGCRHAGARDHRDRQRSGSPPTSPRNSATRRWCCAAASPGRRCGSRWSTGSTRSSATPGSTPR